ncbi:serine/threonine-protein phosphatase [bacterium]|nr:serine/threonine-protein phosphatase [bacterium]
METHRLAGYRIISFSEANKSSLQEIAEQLLPQQNKILDEWLRLQSRAWQPPGFSRSDLRNLFDKILSVILTRMAGREIELCITELEDIGTNLAKHRYPFQGLIVSIHFLEQSYTPFLLTERCEKTQEWFIAMDEFLHAALAAMATSYFESYRKELIEEAEVGRIVQEGLLAEIPKKTFDLEVAHIYISAREKARLGGDFLDFFTLDGGGAAFIIGDLAGHGLDAAADSVMLRSLFRGFVRENADLADAMTRVNRVSDSELKSGLFATALAVKYEPCGRLSLVNAGHCHPIVCDGKCHLLELGGNALAIRDDSKYELARFDLKPGGVFVAYTDGLIEARNKKREFFGESGIMTALSEAHDATARAIAEHIVDRSLAFAGGKFADDVAILVFKRKKDDCRG